MNIDSQIRLLEQDDTQTALHLLVSVFGQKVNQLARGELERMFSREPFRPYFIGAFDDLRLIGVVATVQLLFTTDTFGLCWVCVHPDRQRQGLGTRLVVAAIEFTRLELLRQKPGTLLLNVSDELSGFYRRLGFARGSSMHGDGLVMSMIVNQRSDALDTITWNG